MSTIERQLYELEVLWDRLLSFKRMDIIVMLDIECDFYARIVSDVMDTIKSLSAKLQARAFNNGWIYFSDEKPKEDEFVLIYAKNGELDEYLFGAMIANGRIIYDVPSDDWNDYKEIAWQPLPEIPKDKE